MSDNQNAETGDGKLDPQSNKTVADGKTTGGSLAPDRPKTSESLKSLIAPVKTIAKTDSESETSSVSPKISTITGRVVPKTKTSEKPDVAAFEQQKESARVADRENSVKTEKTSNSADHEDGDSSAPDVPSPPTVPSLSDTDSEGLFSWSSAHVMDIMDDGGKPEIAKPGTTIDARISSTRLEAQIPSIQPQNIEETEPASAGTPDSAVVDALPEPDKPQTPSEHKAVEQPLKPATTTSGLTAAIANRFGGKSSFTDIPAMPPVQPAAPTVSQPSIPAQTAAPGVSQPSLPAQTAAPTVSQQSLPVQAAAPGVSQPSIPAETAAPTVPQQSLPALNVTPSVSQPLPAEPAAPNVSQPSLTAAKPLAPPPVPFREPISIKAPAGYSDFNAGKISDEEFFDEDELENDGKLQLEPTPDAPQSLAAPKGAAANPNRKISLIGQTLFDNYAVMDLIGEGSYCFVYSAMQLNNDDVVAVKTPKVLNPQVKEKFQQAVVKQGRLKHPHIIKSLHYLESPDGQPFYMMENQQGVTLEEILQSVEKLDDEDAIALILTQTASALEYAHNHQCTHDRLTPHNILLIDENEQLQVKVCDFQIAAAADIAGDTTSKTKAFAYLSPETLSGATITAQSDVYSLGAIAFRMATGHLPFDGRGRVDAEQAPEPLARFNPDLKRVHQLNEIVQEALDAEPQYRTDSITSFKQAVQEWIQAVHAEFAEEPEYDTTEVPVMDLGEVAPYQPHDLYPGGESETPIPYQQPEQTPVVENHQTPPVVPTTELGNLVQEVTPQQRRKIRKSQSRTGPQRIRSTIRELVALKKKQSNQEQTVVMKFAEQVAAQTAGPRRSPLATMARLIGFIVVCGGLTIGCITYILTNPKQVREMYFQASRQLSMILPGRKTEPEEIPVEEGPKIVLEKPKKDASPFKRKLKPHEIHTNLQPWAVPRQPGQTNASSDSPSFGVTNNSAQNKRRASRVRIEYSNYDDHPK